MSAANKTCPHGEQFVACDECDLDLWLEEHRVMLRDVRIERDTLRSKLRVIEALVVKFIANEVSSTEALVEIGRLSSIKAAESE